MAARLPRPFMRVMMGIQLLPMVPVPFSALVLWNQGFVAFFIFELILLTIIIVLNRLTEAQESLNVQVSQLRSFSAMNRALRTTLNIDHLLQTTYYQVANLVLIKNVHIILNEQPEGDTPAWRTRLVVEGGKMLRGQQPAREVDGLARFVLNERVALVADPVEGEARKLKIENLPDKARAWMGVPLIAGGKTLGCVAVWIAPGELPDRVLVEADLDLLAAVCAQTAVALENALLYQSAQQQASQLEQLNQIRSEEHTSELQSPTNLVC